MDDTPFSDNLFSGSSFDDDAFAPVAFDGNGDYDDDDDMIDDNCSIADEGDLSDIGSYGSIEDIEYQQGIEDQQEVVSCQSPGSSTSSSSVYVQERRRSKYAERRCKSVDMMTQRLMIHADEYYKNTGRKRRNRALCSVCLAFGVIAVIAVSIFLLKPLLQKQQLPPQGTSAAAPAVDLSSQNTNVGQSNNIYVNGRPNNSNNLYESNSLVKVPFANQHNLRFDGLLFVKQDTTSGTSIHGAGLSSSAPVSTRIYDSYAKTLDPITELHFAPGESNTAKHIVLTTTEPDLVAHNGMSQDPSQMLNNDPGLILSIGLEANGEVWLPQNTGQRIVDVDHYDRYTTYHNNHNHHHHTHTDITKNIYGPGDRFVLRISKDAISLFRNDRHELLGMWLNPTSTPPTSTLRTTTTNPPQLSSPSPTAGVQPLYAQIWFKDPKSSMVANAFYDNRIAKGNGVH